MHNFQKKHTLEFKTPKHLISQKMIFINNSIGVVFCVFLLVVGCIGFLKNLSNGLVIKNFHMFV